MRTIKKSFFIITVALNLLASNAFTQEIQTYDSAYTINNRNYLARYQYYISQGDTIYDGKFQLSQEFENQKDVHEYLSVDGYFIENRADEDWVLKKGSFSTSGSGYFKDYTYSYNVNGNEFMAEGKLLAGKKIGEWTLYDWQIRDSEIQDTTLLATINFKKDKAYGDFRLQFEQHIFEGELAKDEKAFGIWSLYNLENKQSKKLVKQWVFEDHVLIAIRVKIDGNLMQEIKVNNSSNASQSEQIIPLDQDFLDIIELKAKIYNKELLKKYTQNETMSSLYFTLLGNLEMVDNTFSPIIKNHIKPDIVSKLPTFEIDQKEEDLLEDIRAQYEVTIQKINSILSNAQFSITSVSTNKVAQYKNVLEDIKNYFLLPTDQILSLYNNDQLKFFNRNDLIQFKIKLSNESEVNEIFKNDSLSSGYELRSAMNLSADASHLSKLSKLMKALDEELQLIENDLQQYLQEIQEEEKLVELEDTMLTQYRRVKYLADSLITGEHDNFAGINVADAIIDFAETELTNYSNLSSADEKIIAIKPLINCFSRTEELIFTISKAPESIYKVNEAYTKEVFNPYTFTNMEEKSKPSIYKAFNQLLLPAIFQNVQNLTCDNLDAFQDNFKILYEEMIALLTKDNTNRMERKVKRAKTPEKAADLLEMKLSF